PRSEPVPSCPYRARRSPSRCRLFEFSTSCASSAHSHNAAESSRPSDHLRRERNDFHELLVSQLSGNRAEDARSNRLVQFCYQHGGVRVETDVGPVLAASLLTHP